MTVFARVYAVCSGVADSEITLPGRLKSFAQISLYDLFSAPYVLGLYPKGPKQAGKGIGIEAFALGPALPRGFFEQVEPAEKF